MFATSIKKAYFVASDIAEGVNEGGEKAVVGRVVERHQKQVHDL